MTLDEAIKHAEETAENKYGLANAYHTDEGVYLVVSAYRGGGR